MPEIEVARLRRDWRTAGLDPRRREMCRFAERLAERSSGTGLEEVEALRMAGLDDREILDLVQLVAYYSYVNRIASALGVELEPARAEQNTDPPAAG